jgi:hypothetical protein
VKSGVYDLLLKFHVYIEVGIKFSTTVFVAVFLEAFKYIFRLENVNSVYIFVIHQSL